MNLFVIFFCISLFIFFISMIIAFINKNNKSKLITILLVGDLIALGFLVFMIHNDLDIVTRIIYSVFYVFDAPTMSADFDILNKVPTALLVYYKYLLYFYCVLAPILAVGVIVTFLEDKMFELFSKIRTKKTVHIFSEVNEKSVTLAETIKNKDNKIIVCDNNEKSNFIDQLAKIKAIILKKQIKNIDFSKYLGEIRIYEISDDQDKNLNQTLDLISMYKNTKQDITIYIFSTKSEAQVILDSVDKGNVKTIIINEIQQMVYRVLDEVPLYKNTKDNISVLVVGAGKIGSEFIKAITWCGQIVGYKLEINIIDKNAIKIEKEFSYKYPELNKPNYNINFYEADIKSIDTYQIIKEKFKDTNYIIISIGDDNDNLNCAIEMRQFFLRKNKKPIININVENSEKKKQIEVLKNEIGHSYDLHTFGDIEELYSSRNILNEKIELLAQQVHLNYNFDDINLIEYYKIEYYKNSSRASALHLKYKIYSILKDEKNPEILNSEKTRELLAENEHNRWCAYIRSLGYSYASLKEVKEYKDETKHYVNHLAKLHPALVPYKELDKISKELSSLMNETIDFKKNDFNVIDALIKINNKRK